MNYSNGTDPFLEVEAEVRDQGRGNALWVRQQPWSLGSIIPLPTASLGFDSSPTLHALKNGNTKHSRHRKNRCISRTCPSIPAGCCISPSPLVPRRHRHTLGMAAVTLELCHLLLNSLKHSSNLIQSSGCD